MSKILLAGNAITADILYSYLRSDTRYSIAGCVVDDAFVAENGISGCPTVGISEAISAFPPATCSVIMAMGYNDLNRSREAMFARLKSMGFCMETYIHPEARIYTNKPVGEGSVVLPGAIVEPQSSVGTNSMIWSNVTIAHHSSVGDHCWVAAGSVVSGQARIQHNTFLGVNSTVVNDVTVGEYNIVGAGAMISRDTKPSSVHLARSAEPFRYSSEEYIKHFGI